MNYFERTLESLRLFGGRHALGLSLPTKQNAHKWLERIENELSPENLCCDGELRGSALRAKHNELLSAQRHCQSLLGVQSALAVPGIHFIPQGYAPVMPTQSQFSLRAKIAQVKRERHAARRTTLDKAVHSGFVPGKRVLLSNGLRGKIVKINKTRVRVLTDDGKQWNVPPRCMELERIIR